MPVSTDEPNPITDDQGSGDNGNNGKRIYAMNGLPERPLNLYDDPIKVLIGSPIYKLMIVIAMIQSSSVLVFLRDRIGKRVMRGWIFQLSFLILMTIGSGSVYVFLNLGHEGMDIPVIVYALLMALLAIYHYHVGRELTDPEIPERLKLHTRARGDSFLVEVMEDLPSLTIPMWHFYAERFYPQQILPLSEPFIQRVVEPVLLVVSGVFFTRYYESWLGFWLIVSAVNLAIVEADYQNNAMEALDDQYDARLESQTMRIIQESLSHNRKLPAKLNGMVTSGIARVSETLAQLQKERSGSNE